MSRARRKVWIVASELAPATRGGIGALYAQMFRDLGTYPDVDVTFFGVGIPQLALARATGGLSNVTGVTIDPDHPTSTCDIPRRAFTAGEWHWRSYLASRTLIEQIQLAGTPEVIEFQDYGGLAYYFLNERLLAEASDSTLVAIRLHGTEAALRLYEPRLPSEVAWATVEIELAALRLCDAVIEHVPGALNVLAPYGINASQSLRILNSPPIAVPHIKNPSSGPPGEMRLIFASKMQHLKAPDVFVRGVSEFLATSSSFLGTAIFDCADATPETVEALTKNLSPQLQARFEIAELAGGDDRLQRMSGQVVIIPGPIEHFSMLAHESRRVGACPILNGANVAFSEEAGWIDSVNCFKFDGTASDLARTLERAYQQGWKLEQPGTSGGAAEPYFTLAEPLPILSAAGSNSVLGEDRPHGSIAVVVTNFNLASYLPDALLSLIDAEHRPDQVIVVDDGSPSDVERRTAEEFTRVAQNKGLPVEFLQLPANMGLGAARNRGLREVGTDYVLFLDADDVVERGFLARAARILDRYPAIDVIVPQVAMFESIASSDSREFPDYALFFECARGLYLSRNRISSATNLARRSVLGPDPFNERLTAYEDWDLWSRLIQQGVEFRYDYNIGLFYRVRAESMAAQTRLTPAHDLNLDLLRSRRVCEGAPHSAALILNPLTDQERMKVSVVDLPNHLAVVDRTEWIEVLAANEAWRKTLAQEVERASSQIASRSGVILRRFSRMARRGVE